MKTLGFVNPEIRGTLDFQEERYIEPVIITMATLFVSITLWGAGSLSLSLAHSSYSV